jgi:hypothetical protein
MNEKITPLLPTGIGERYCQTISNLGHAALLRRSETPPIKECAELTHGALLLIYYSEVFIKPAFAEREKKQTLMDLCGISKNWFKNQFCPYTRLSRLWAREYQQHLRIIPAQPASPSITG